MSKRERPARPAKREKSTAPIKRVNPSRLVKGNKNVLRVNLIDQDIEEESPKIALFNVEKKGTVKKVATIDGDEVNLTELKENLKGSGKYGFGPEDVEEKEVTEEMLVTFNPKYKISEWEKTGVLEINPKWKDWVYPLTCVHGDVKKCFPTLLPYQQVTLAPKLDLQPKLKLRPASFSLNQKIAPALPILPKIDLCAPICNAVVEVYEKTCCCQIVLPEIDYWVDKLRDWIIQFPIPLPDPPFPEVVPHIDPIPGPRPDPVPYKEKTRNIKLVRATDIKTPLGNPPMRVVQDVETLSILPQTEQLQYVEARPYLYPIFCSCTSKKVGETAVNEKGEFSLCFMKKLVKYGCNVSYYYKVRQWQENQWVYIYDGTSVNEYFGADEDALLRTWKGIACQPEEGITPDDEFVLLENIGEIPSWKLNSPLQNSESGLSSANTGDGLVDHNYVGQPWGKTLSFRLKFSEGLKALGAKYYRISVVRADSNGDSFPGAIPEILTSALSWKRWINVGGQIKTEAISLGPNVVNGEGGLYQIPYDDDAPLGWLWFQYHQSWNTTNHDNGKHLAILEIFDNNGNRLKPTGSAGTGNAVPFSYRRWVDEENTNAVNFAALVHMFHVDNVSCYGDIVDLRKNGNPSTEECQFITGCTDDAFSVGFYAFHENNFMSSYTLWYHRGLNGPNVTIETGTTNAPSSVPPVPSPLDSSNSKQSNSKTFDEMLGPHQKCSFSVELRVYPKHTDGFDVIWGYGSSDNAALALEKVLCINPGIIAPQVLAEKNDLPNVTKNITTSATR